MEAPPLPHSSSGPSMPPSSAASTSAEQIIGGSPPGWEGQCPRAMLQSLLDRLSLEECQEIVTKQQERIAAASIQPEVPPPPPSGQPPAGLLPNGTWAPLNPKQPPHLLQPKQPPMGTWAPVPESSALAVSTVPTHIPKAPPKAAAVVTLAAPAPGVVCSGFWTKRHDWHELTIRKAKEQELQLVKPGLWRCPHCYHKEVAEGELWDHLKSTKHIKKLKWLEEDRLDQQRFDNGEYPFDQPWMTLKYGKRYCIICDMEATEGHIASQKHQKWVQWCEEQQNGGPAPVQAALGAIKWSSMPSDEPVFPPEWGNPAHFKWQNDQWYCLLCYKYADDNHCASEKHLYRASQPEVYLQTYVTSSCSSHFDPPPPQSTLPQAVHISPPPPPPLLPIAGGAMQSQEPMAVKAPPAYLRAQVPPQAAQCLPKHSGIQQVVNGWENGDWKKDRDNKDWDKWNNEGGTTREEMPRGFVLSRAQDSAAASPAVPRAGASVWESISSGNSESTAQSQCVPKQYSFRDPWSGEETYCGPWQ